MTNILAPLAGGQAAFDQYFHLENREVVLNEGVDTSKMNSGEKLVAEMIQSSDNFIYYAGTSGSAVANLFQHTNKDSGKLNSTGKEISNLFTCGGSYLGGCGTVVGTLGRPGTSDRQPADLANGDPVFAVIAYNELTVQTQTGTGVAGQLTAEGNGKVVAPFSLFLHESAENLAFRSQGDWDYDAAHSSAIVREYQIRHDLSNPVVGLVRTYKVKFQRAQRTRATYMRHKSGMSAGSLARMLVSFVLAASTRLILSQCAPVTARTTEWGGNTNVIMREHEPMRSLHGIVVQDVGSHILSGVLVEVYDQPEVLSRDPSRSRAGQKRIAACVTDKSGAFSFELPPGHYEVRFSKSSEWNVTSVPVLVTRSASPTRKGIVARLLIAQ